MTPILAEYSEVRDRRGKEPAYITQKYVIYRAVVHEDSSECGMEGVSHRTTRGPIAATTDLISREAESSA